MSPRLVVFWLEGHKPVYLCFSFDYFVGLININLIKKLICDMHYYLNLSFAAPGISASPSEDNMRYFNVMILGPSQSPYEGTSCVVSRTTDFLE